MRREIPFRLGVITILGFANGCGSPAVTYQLAADDGSTPPKGAIGFQLRSSDITVVKGTQLQGETPSPQSPPPAANPTPPVTKGGKPAAKGAASPPAGTNSAPTTDITTVQEVCGANLKGDEWPKCFSGIKAIATPTTAQEKTFYMAPSNDWLGFYTTQVGSTTSDNDDLSPSKVSITFKDNRATVIGNVGTNAVTGLGLAGPAGAAIGAVVGLAEGAPGLNAMIEEPPGKFSTFKKLICTSDDPYSKWGPTPPENPRLVLPVVLGDKVVRNVASDPPGCWHLLPDNSGLGGFVIENGPPVSTQASGWLYRIVLHSKAPNTVTPDSFFDFKTNGKATASTEKNSFAYSSCRTADVEVTWWSALEAARAEIAAIPEAQQDKLNLDAVKPALVSYTLKIADPDNLEVAPLPAGGDINLLSVCGANVVYTATTSSGTKDAIDALVKQIQSVKSAQEKKNGTNSPTQTAKAAPAG